MFQRSILRSILETQAATHRSRFPLAAESNVAGRAFLRSRHRTPGDDAAKCNCWNHRSRNQGPGEAYSCHLGQRRRNPEQCDSLRRGDRIHGQVSRKPFPARHSHGLGTMEKWLCRSEGLLDSLVLPSGLDLSRLVQLGSSRLYRGVARTRDQHPAGKFTANISRRRLWQHPFFRAGLEHAAASRYHERCGIDAQSGRIRHYHLSTLQPQT
jgi:hypothetical protein